MYIIQDYFITVEMIHMKKYESNEIIINFINVSDGKNQQLPNKSIYFTI